RDEDEAEDREGGPRELHPRERGVIEVGAHFGLAREAARRLARTDKRRADDGEREDDGDHEQAAEAAEADGPEGGCLHASCDAHPGICRRATATCCAATCASRNPSNEAEYAMS